MSDAAAQYQHGNLLWQRGAREDAVAAYASAVALDPDNADARNNLGNALVELGRSEAAIPHLAEALALRPDHAPAHYNLGNALVAAGRGAEAEERFRSALRLDPRHAGALNNLGNLLRTLQRPEEAAECYRRVIALHPTLAGAHNNLGSVLLALHRPEAAEVALREALRLHPDYADAANNLGGALLALDGPDAALEAFRRAVALDPSQAQARFGESLALLALGRFREGWAAYESRWLDPRFREDERSYDMPAWTDATAQGVAGRTVLLHAEQGLGDTIQFVRYAPLLRERGARVVLEVQPALLTLLAPLGDHAIAAGDPLPACDLHCPMLSLPRLFGTELPTVPAHIPYLTADAERRDAWRRRLGPRNGLRIGLAISGSPEHPDDPLRSIPAAALSPLLAVPGVAFHLVQKDVRAADAAVLRGYPHVTIHAEHLGDFEDTAALLCELDLLVSVDTSVAHLGGALGLPVWLLVQFGADFRWLRVREDSPWYPTMRLFRQTEAQRWAPVVARIADTLARRVRAQAGSARPASPAMSAPAG